MEPIILASSSPRRQEILKMLKIPFRVIIPNIDETVLSAIETEQVPELLARQKITEVIHSLPPKQEIPWVLGADTIVTQNGKIFGKPQSVEEAVEFLDNPVRIKKLSDYFSDDNNRDDRNGYGKFLLNTCFVKDSDYKTPAYTWRKSDNETIWWGNVNSLTPSYGKSLYGVYNNYSSNGKGCGLIKIIDEDGNKDGQYISALNDYKLSDLQTAESGFYFRSALLDSEGEETGQHQVMFYNAESEALENLFERVANNKELEVVSFSVGGDYVYYCAARGITVMNGKINIRTKEAQLLSADRKLSQIISIK